MQPSLFISHGAPNVVIEPTAVRAAIMGLSEQLERPDAIIIASAHFETDVAEVVSDAAPQTMYDFGGFDPSLYEMVYAAPGSPQLAQEVLIGLDKAGIECRLNPQRAFDHGVWTPLMLAFPEADIPVVQLSIQHENDAAYHFKLGNVLSKLRHQNVLVIGSGHITHNLREVFSAMQGRQVPSESSEKIESFVDWIGNHLEAGDTPALLNWFKQAPNAAHNHPSTEHFMPLFVAYGAGCLDGTMPDKSTLLHRSTQFEVFTSDIWRFD